MPSAASVKVENSPTTNISANNAVAAKEAAAQSENVDNSSPVRQISLIIEHKIRNLEKRKVSQNQNQNQSKSQHFCVIRTKQELRTNTMLVRVPCVRVNACFFFRCLCGAYNDLLRLVNIVLFDSKVFEKFTITKFNYFAYYILYTVNKLCTL